MEDETASAIVSILKDIASRGCAKGRRLYCDFAKDLNGKPVEGFALDKTVDDGLPRIVAIQVGGEKSTFLKLAEVERIEFQVAHESFRVSFHGKEKTSLVNWDPPF